MSAILLLASVASAQYNFQQDDSEGYDYKKPTTPPRAYLPPTTTKKYESESDIAADFNTPPKDVSRIFYGLTLTNLNFM